MKLILTILLILVCLGIVQLANGKGRDEAIDSSRYYRKIENFSAKYSTTKFVYGTIFKPVAKKSSKNIIRKKRPAQQNINQYEGKIIRDINITTLDPFGYSVTDTVVQKQILPYKFGNGTHIKTMRITILNLLLFQKNQPFDALKVRESERLIRSQAYIHDVLLTYKMVPKTDSVDIFIRELDLWTIIPAGSVNRNKNQFAFTEKNFFGTGHEFQASYTRKISPTISGYKFSYFVPNIRNTYITGNLHYENDVYYNISRTVGLNRTFYSPLARWAGGISYGSFSKNDSLIYAKTYAFVPFDSRFTMQDYWGGLAIHLYKGKTDKERTTNIIVSLRYQRMNYIEQPSTTYDPSDIFSDGDFYLAGIGISSRQYDQDKYVFKYGATEDVPVGFVFGVTGGYQFKSTSARTYVGLRAAYGTYFKWGYISPQVEYGTFVHSLRAEQSVLKAEISCYTNLFELGKWKFRQFVKPQYVLGVNRFPSESININGINGLSGFKSGILLGTRKLLLTLQTQSYAPWNLAGFHFGPYLIGTFGMVGDANSGFKNRRIYSQISLGMLIKNEFLIFSFFQISVAFIPTIPGGGNNIFDLNPTSTVDYGYHDFMLAKPDVVIYR